MPVECLKLLVIQRWISTEWEENIHVKWKNRGKKPLWPPSSLLQSKQPLHALDLSSFHVWENLCLDKVHSSHCRFPKEPHQLLFLCRCLTRKAKSLISIECFVPGSCSTFYSNNPECLQRFFRKVSFWLGWFVSSQVCWHGSVLYISTSEILQRGFIGVKGKQHQTETDLNKSLLSLGMLITLLPVTQGISLHRCCVRPWAARLGCFLGSAGPF